MKPNEFGTKEPSLKDVTNGAETVPYNEKAKCWVKVGGGKLVNRKHAEQYAAKLNQMIGRSL